MARMPHAALLLLSTASVFAPFGAIAQPFNAGPPVTISGDAVAIESDIIGINGQVIYLYGVDGPLQIQTCLLDNRDWACGPVAKRELEVLVDTGPATCVQVPDTSFRRRALLYARCEVGAVDLSAEMVRRGMVMAFPEQSTDYVALEAEAKAAKAGLWRAEVFEPPWEWEFRMRTE